jgi:phosphoglycolate phosphatase-like HAD superfamily hydrolase
VAFAERALIFDVDGTLVDSNDAHAASWSEALRDFEIERDVGSLLPLIGMGGDELLPRAAGVSADSDLGRQISARRRELFRTVYFAHLSPFLCVRELFRRLRGDGVRLGIASSASKAELDALLDLAGVRDLVDPRTGANDVDASSPDPDAVQDALNRLGVEPGAALMVGDSPHDIEAASRAHVGTIAVRCGGWDDRDLEGAIAIYDSPMAILADYDTRTWDWPAAPTILGRRRGGPLPANSSLR